MEGKDEEDRGRGLTRGNGSDYHHRSRLLIQVNLLHYIEASLCVGLCIVHHIII